MAIGEGRGLSGDMIDVYNKYVQDRREINKTEDRSIDRLMIDDESADRVTRI